MGFWACITFFVLSWNGHCLEKGLCLYSLLGSYSCHSSSFPWACWPCWPIGLTASFLGLLRPTYLIFTSYSSHGHVGCYSCHVGPFGLLPLFLGFLDSLTSSLSLVLPMLTSSLPLILPMGLLAVILAMLVHWACYLFSWASLAHLLHLYLLFFPWACWLLFLPCWPIRFTNLFLPFIFPFSFTSFIAGLLLLLDLLSKMGINRYKIEILL